MTSKRKANNSHLKQVRINGRLAGDPNWRPSEEIMKKLGIEKWEAPKDIFSNINPDDIRVIEGEVHIRDMALGLLLEMAQPRDIRRVIVNNLADLDGYGKTRVERANFFRSQYWLNQGQAIRVASLSRTKVGSEIIRNIINFFMRARNEINKNDPNWVEVREFGKPKRKSWASAFAECGARRRKKGGNDYAKGTNAGYIEYLGGTRLEVVEQQHYSSSISFRDQLPMHKNAGITAYETRTVEHKRISGASTVNEFIALTAWNAKCQKEADMKALNGIQKVLADVNRVS